jgi:hypothetical protein
LVDQHHVAAATISFALASIKRRTFGSCRARSAGEIEKRLRFRFLIERRQHHNVQVDRPSGPSQPIFKNS